MELDELKKELNLKITSHQDLPAVDIALMLKKDTLSIIQKIQRSIKLEILISVLFVGACIYMVLFDNRWIYNIFFGLFGIVGLVFIVALMMLFKKTKNLSVSPVKENIRTVTSILEEYLKRYLQLTVGLLPVCFAIGLWLSYNNPESILKPMEMRSIIFLSVTMIAIGTGFYFFTKWYLQKLYGEYVLQLKALLKELDEQ